MRVRYTDDLSVGRFEERTLQRPEEVLEIIHGLDRAAFPCIEVTDSRGRRLEGSGSDEDGYSIILEQHGNEFITKDGPTFEELAACFEAFMRGEEDWQKVEFVPIGGKSGCLGAVLLGAIVGVVLMFQS